jgi:hypothetical protein
VHKDESWPLVSILIVVKNGMPLVQEALKSITVQTYRQFEVIVQDGASSDGTPEAVTAQRSLERVDLVSEWDSGRGDAFARALRRATGDVIVTVDADNLLEMTALQDAVDAFRTCPSLAAVYGSCREVDGDGRQVGVFRPDEFSVTELLLGRLVPPFATAFFNRRVCGNELFVDSSFVTCPDFDLWLRLSDLPIARLDAVLASQRTGPASGTAHAELYDQFCSDKLRAARRYLEGRYRGRELRRWWRKSVAGIHMWAALSVTRLSGSSEASAPLASRAYYAYPSSVPANMWPRIPSAYARKAMRRIAGLRRPRPVG